MSKFAQPFSSNSYATDNGTFGTTYNISASGNTLPKVFNFTANNSNYISSNEHNLFFWSHFTTDISTQFILMSFIVVTGNGTHSAVYGWTDTGDGVVTNGELFSLAVFSNVDNDNLSAANFSFGVI